jgi:hypothetical protein
MTQHFRPNIIDFEASGLGNNTYPIEVGVILRNGNKFCALITPAPEWQHWDEQAEKIHGISRETLQKYGKPVREVAIELNQFILNETVYSDCWVVDKPWMSTLFAQAKVIPSFNLCALEMILKEQQLPLWSNTKQQVLEELGITRHRASSDALLIQETYVRTRLQGLTDSIIIKPLASQLFTPQTSFN